MNKKNINSDGFFEKQENTIQKSFDTSLKTRIAYCHGTLIDTITPINWGFLGFTFYFAVVGLPIIYLTIATIIFAFWDAFNDPIIGVISDRTKSRIGRRKIWLFITSIPMVIITVLLWTPPLNASYVIIFIYYLVIIMIFDLIYTFFTVNINALWPEMFLTIEERTNIGFWRNIFMIIAVTLAYLVPGLIIEDMANRKNLPQTPIQYLVSGIIIAAIVFISFINLLNMPFSTQMLLFVLINHSGEVLDYSLIIALFQIGFVIGAIIALVKKHWKHKELIILYSCFIGIAGYSLLTLAPKGYFIIMALGALIHGTMIPIANTMFLTILQTKIPAETQGRVFSIVASIAAAVTPLGMLISGPIADLIGIQLLFIFALYLQFVSIVITWYFTDLKNIIKTQSKPEMMKEQEEVQVRPEQIEF